MKREKGVEREKMSVTCKDLVEYIKEQMPVHTVIIIVEYIKEQMSVGL